MPIPSTKQTIPKAIRASNSPLIKPTNTFTRRSTPNRIRPFQTTAIDSNAQSNHAQHTDPSSSAQKKPHNKDTQSSVTKERQTVEVGQIMEEKETKTVRRALPKTFSEPIPSQAEEFSFPDYPTIEYPSHYNVICISDPKDMNKQMINLLSKKETVFGLDMEWQPQFQKGKPQHKVGLIQICSSDSILLFQTARLHVLPTELVRFLKNPNLFKSGVNIRGDGLKLQRDFNVVTNGLVELERMTRHIDSPLLMQTHKRSLSALTSLFLEKNMPKSKSVRLSNWARVHLTAQQIRYAACDAYASYRLCTVFRDLLLKQHKSHITSFIIHLSNESITPKEEDKPPSLPASASSSAPKTTSKTKPTHTTIPAKEKKFEANRPWPSSTTTVIRKAP